MFSLSVKILTYFDLVMLSYCQLCANTPDYELIMSDLINHVLYCCYSSNMAFIETIIMFNNISLRIFVNILIFIILSAVRKIK